MPVTKQPSGRRSIQVEAEVPGTPEQVWQAIASGPGVSAWFVPTTMELGTDGQPARILSNFGPGMDAVATVTAWEPLRRFTAESQNYGPDVPAMLTEWSIEARSGGTCIVRVVHSMAATSDAWDKELESMESGWPGFFRILRLYLTHFAGQPCHAIREMAMPSGSEKDVWAAFTQSLGIAKPEPGQHVRSGSSAPPLAGITERASDWPSGALLLRIHEPAPGIAAFGAFNCGGQVMVSLCLNFYGDGAEAVAAKHAPKWKSWLADIFPTASGANA